MKNSKKKALVLSMISTCLIGQLIAVENDSSIYKNRKFAFPGGKVKAVIMSYDDGLTQDRHLVGIFNKYGIKGTFNLNSGKIGCKAPWLKDQIGREGEYLNNDEIKKLYRNHEIASHTLTHPNLLELNNYGIQKEVESDISYLEQNFGVKVVSFAYPFGTDDKRTLSELKKTKLTNARTIADTGAFGLPENFLVWDPSCHHSNAYKIIDKFFDDYSKKPILFYIWGHSWELDRNKKHNGWKYMENLCRKLSQSNDIWFCTTGEFVNYVNAVKSLKEKDGMIINDSSIPVWINGKTIVEIPANSSKKDPVQLIKL